MYLRSSASCHGYAAGRDGDDDAINPLTNDSGADCYEGRFNAALSAIAVSFFFNSSK